MPRHPKSRDFNLAPFVQETGPYATKYGLPEQVAFCTRCVISNQRPNSAVEYGHTSDSKKVTIHLDEEGVCDPCRMAEMKQKTIDWEEREHELHDLCDRHRRTDGLTGLGFLYQAI